MQCAPWYPESHNLNGLVYEGRQDFQSAVASYKLARYALKTSTFHLPHSHFSDLSVNLARALCKVCMHIGFFSSVLYSLQVLHAITK